MPKILIVHGAGMNMRGKVQTEIFGKMTLPELGRLLTDEAWPFVPDTRTLLARLCRERVGDYAALGRSAAAAE